MTGRKWPVSDRDPQPLWFQVINWAAVGVVVLVTAIIVSAALGQLLAWIVEWVLG